MTYAKVPGECIGSAEYLLFLADIAAYLLLACVMYGKLVSRKIVRPRENRVAWLPCARVDPFTFVRARLTVGHVAGRKTYTSRTS
jgi:hypothetical protein